MMETHTGLALITLISGFYMAWNIGANDVANAMGTSVGSKALTLKRAVILAALLEFSGAFFVGSSVSETIQKGILDPHLFSDTPSEFVFGMLASLIATGILLQSASYLGLPVSTTHAIVGAVLGFGIIARGPSAVQWSVVGEIASSWILSPFLSGVISFGIFSLIQKKILYAIDPLAASKRWVPLFVFLCIALLSWSVLYGGLLNLHFELSFPSFLICSCGCAIIAALLCFYFLQRTLKKRAYTPTLQTSSGFLPEQTLAPQKTLCHLQRAYLCNHNRVFHEEPSPSLETARFLSNETQKSVPSNQQTSHYASAEKVFTSLQILSACLVAFAHGANDVANAIGPMSAILNALYTHSIASNTSVPPWLLGLGGFGIVIGLATWGWRVIETVGKKITELTPTRGFSAEFGAATTILAASQLGLPISTTHALIGAIFGVGIARGLQAINFKTLLDIVISWVITLPLCALICISIFYLLRWIF